MFNGLCVHKWTNWRQYTDWLQVKDCTKCGKRKSRLI